MARVLFVESHAPFARSFLAAARGSLAGRAPQAHFSFTWAAGATEAKELAGPSFELGLIALRPADASDLRLLDRLARTTNLRLVAFTTSCTRVRAALEMGASGYLLKDEPVEHVLCALDLCLNGGMPLSDRAARHLVPTRRLGEDRGPLTRREDEVLARIAQGLSYADCAATLGVGLGTVQTHIKSAYRKLDIRTKAEAAAWVERQNRGH